MISYERLWQTMKERGVSQYKLVEEYGISKGTLDKLRKNTHITTFTLENFCRILNCRIEDIVEYIPDEDTPEPR
ncbi:MAG: helix-turn-helix transcriptional regulator [Clostridia bacterium]|nr:helix-turn-helix transcriptional regulator [Clostridia bacterium]